eukprot:gnl/MRDRNA2_/MRDRNA2_106375_c0_seq1.p1 gnl/MRDRNA2_/MRDRNA2_106375_c0~~gnl/MRDRNA2_/MRDRNA2_106375_c0_seq1.p1  ORF type:complete len:717 (-),score=137.55 gnl/MRDRNA2_/MRDRNA2_106375_c0_seq1:261-2342(-)
MGKEDDEHALFEYSRRGNVAEVEELLAQGLKPECYYAYDGTTPLLVAARGGKTGVVMALLQAKADITIRTEDGSSALHHSISGGSAATVAAILGAGMDPNDENEEGVTPLMLAAHYNDPELTKVLLDAGADPNICVAEWGTALDNATGAVAELLKSKGGRPGDKNVEKKATAGEHFGYGCFDREEDATKGFESNALPEPELKPKSTEVVAEQSHSGIQAFLSIIQQICAPVLPWKSKNTDLPQEFSAAENSEAPKECVPLGPSEKYATPEATKRFLQKLRCGKGSEPRLLGKTGLHVSPVGFGCHRLGSSDSEIDALRASIKLGVNLIDTAPNYTDGVAETTCGQVFKSVFEDGTCRREDLVICTKVGNIVGNRLVGVKQRGGILDGAAKVRDDVWHCISPAWIEEEITGSLERMGLECIDVLLLHCPEFATKAPDVDMNEVYARIKRACEYLETEVARGRICRYGITAAFYPMRPSDPQHLVLSGILESLPANHHFQVLQFPLNFAEPQGLLQGQCARTPEGSPLIQNAGLGPSLVELCQSHGIATLINRPLDGAYKEVAGSLRFVSDVPFGSAMQGEDIDQLEDKLTRICPGLGDTNDPVSEQLAGKTVRCLTAVDGIDCVLVGMRQPQYVASVMMAVAQGDVEPQKAYDAVRSMHNSLGMWFATSCMSSDHGTSKDWRLPVEQKYGQANM